MKIFKLAFLGVFLVLFGLGAGIGVRFLENSFNTGFSQDLAALVPSTGNIELPKEEPPEISLVFVGDIMIDRGVRAKVEKVGNGDFRFPFLKIADILREADIAAGNLEGPLSDKGKEAGNLYSFRMLPRALEGLTSAGFDVLFLANNHIGDWDQEALEDTVLNLKNAGILPVGAGIDLEEAYSPKILEVKGVKFSFLSFADFQEQFKNSEVKNSVALADEIRIAGAVQEAKEKADVVIVAFHFGDEYSAEPNERQRLLANLVIDRGADLVIGSHPHVLQPLETYNDKYIAYSLGNFVFDQNFSKETMTGGLLKVSLKGKEVISVNLYQVRLNENFQPFLE